MNKMADITIHKEFEVPTEVLIEVADLLIEHEIGNEISGTNEEEDTVTLSLSYRKEDKGVIHQITDLIDECNDEEGDDDNDNDDDD